MCHQSSGAMGRTGFGLVLAILLTLPGWGQASLSAAQTGLIPTPAPGKPNIEDYATIESYCNGAPVYSFSNIDYVYGLGPDLLPGAAMQEGNTHPVQKVPPKKSWEIKHNYMGSEHEMTVRTAWTDSQPFLPIHLIDGDPDTVWCSWGSTLFGGNIPDWHPEWIRIDLPAEAIVDSVALVCSKNFSSPYGNALPKDLEIKLSRDAWHWESVYRTKDLAGNIGGTTLIKFTPRPAKQIWILANNFPTSGIFSIGEVEVRDPAGNNLALVSRGAGVTVSSTSYGELNDRFTQDALWGPLQYDLGNKWVRVGPDNGSFTWNYVEMEKGKLQIDRRADESITECVRNGINVIMVLDWKANWRYLNPPRKLNWREARYREINYDNGPQAVTDSPEMFAGYLRYVDYMVRHFKGRVAYFEIGNEWDRMGVAKYIKEIFEPTYVAIKKADPTAKIMLGSPASLSDSILNCLGKPYVFGIQHGKLSAFNDNTLLIVKNVNAKDVAVSVDARNPLGQWTLPQCGIVLRYKDPGNYLAALYDCQGGVFFCERTGGEWGRSYAFKDLRDLKDDIHLTAKVEGALATFTVTDGVKSATTTHTIERYNDAGSVGLYQNMSGEQAFGNFKAAGANGEVILQDNFNGPDGSMPAGWQYVTGGENPIKPGVGARIDAIGVHGGTPDKKFFDWLREYMKKCEALGFRGKFFATEIYARAGYPPGPPGGMGSEMQMAKCYARLAAGYSGLGMEAGPCHPHFSAYAHPQSMSRWTWPVQTINPVMPMACYYVWRNIATVTDDFYPAEFPVRLSGKAEDFLVFTFESGDKKEKMIAAWTMGGGGDGIVEEKTNLSLPGIRAAKAWVVDVFNGTQQELNLTPTGDGTLFKDMLIKDYPTFIRFSQ